MSQQGVVEWSITAITFLLSLSEQGDGLEHPKSPLNLRRCKIGLFQFPKCVCSSFSGLGSVNGPIL